MLKGLSSLGFLGLENHNTLSLLELVRFIFKTAQCIIKAISINIHDLEKFLGMFFLWVFGSHFIVKFLLANELSKYNLVVNFQS
jgi:hypothetical protein